MAEFLEWADSDPSPKTVRAVVAASLDKIVFCGDIHRRDCLALIREVSSPSVQELLESYVSSVPIVLLPNSDAIEEPTIRGRVFENFEDLVMSSEISAAFKAHTKSMSPGESLINGFTRLIGHLLPCTSTFEFIDPFIGSKILEKSPVVGWLVKTISSRSTCDIKILTRIPYRDRESPTRDAALRNIEKIWVHLQSELSRLNVPNQIVIDFYEKMPHNRFIHLRLIGGQSISASIDHGIDAFQTDPVAELEPVKPLDGDELQEIQNSSRWLPRRKGNDDLIALTAKVDHSCNVAVNGPTWAVA